jgi:hypothetical protein
MGEVGEDGMVLPKRMIANPENAAAGTLRRD